MRENILLISPAQPGLPDSIPPGQAGGDEHCPPREGSTHSRFDTHSSSALSATELGHPDITTIPFSQSLFVSLGVEAKY